MHLFLLSYVFFAKHVRWEKPRDVGTRRWAEEMGGSEDSCESVTVKCGVAFVLGFAGRQAGALARSRPRPGTPLTALVASRTLGGADEEMSLVAPDGDEDHGEVRGWSDPEGQGSGGPETGQFKPDGGI